LLKKHAGKFERAPKEFAPDALAAIREHAWPGNVRELENRVRRAMALADGDRITAVDLDLAAAPMVPGDAAPTTPPGVQHTLKQIREEAERRAVVQALAASDFNIQKASRLLGVSRPTLYAMMKTLGIQRQEDRAE